MTGTGILKAFDFSGKELWMRDIQKEYGRFGLNWGYGSSPMLHGDSLFVQVLHGMKTDDPSYVLAHQQGERADDLARRAADDRSTRIAGLVHDTGDCPAWQQPGARHHGRRCRDWA